MKRFLPHLIWISGLLVMFIGLTLGPGVPYQDPTPEMRALEARQMQLCDSFLAVGFCLFVAGIIWAISRWIYRLFSRKTVP
jgi:hypothetical protein